MTLISRIPRDASTAASNGSESPFLTLRDQPMKQVINNLLRGALPAVNATLDGNLSLEGHWQLEFQPIKSIK
jgi:C4-dicarboxylate-specific signal transduction histidine kinase